MLRLVTALWHRIRTSSLQSSLQTRVSHPSGTNVVFPSQVYLEQWDFVLKSNHLTQPSSPQVRKECGSPGMVSTSYTVPGGFVVWLVFVFVSTIVTVEEWVGSLLLSEDVGVEDRPVPGTGDHLAVFLLLSLLIPAASSCCTCKSEVSGKNWAENIFALWLVATSARALQEKVAAMICIAANKTSTTTDNPAGKHTGP